MCKLVKFGANTSVGIPVQQDSMLKRFGNKIYNSIQNYYHTNTAPFIGMVANAAGIGVKSSRRGSELTSLTHLPVSTSFPVKGKDGPIGSDITGRTVLYESTPVSYYFNPTPLGRMAHYLTHDPRLDKTLAGKEYLGTPQFFKNKDRAEFNIRFDQNAQKDLPKVNLAARGVEGSASGKGWLPRIFQPHRSRSGAYSYSPYKYNGHPLNIIPGPNLTIGAPLDYLKRVIASVHGLNSDGISPRNGYLTKTNLNLSASPGIDVHEAGHAFTSPFIDPLPHVNPQIKDTLRKSRRKSLDNALRSLRKGNTDYVLDVSPAYIGHTKPNTLSFLGNPSYSNILYTLQSESPHNEAMLKYLPGIESKKLYDRLQTNPAQIISKLQYQGSGDIENLMNSSSSQKRVLDTPKGQILKTDALNFAYPTSANPQISAPSLSPYLGFNGNTGKWEMNSNWR